MIDLLLLHGVVVTMNPDRQIFEDGAVAIDGNRLLAVGPTEAIQSTYTARRVIDCRGKAIIPGLIDAHGHGGHLLPTTIHQRALIMASDGDSTMVQKKRAKDAGLDTGTVYLGDNLKCFRRHAHLLLNQCEWGIRMDSFG